jgi:ABC-type antimicrobial peptide transport system permease subunit
MFSSVKRLLFLSVRNGLIAGVLGFFLLLALYYMGKHPFLFPIYFDFRLILLSVFIVMTLKEFRDDYQDGILYFGQAMISSFLFTLVFALVVSLLIWFFCFIQPEFLSSYIETATGQLQSIEPAIIEQLGKEAYERNLNKLPATNGSDLAIDYFGKTFIISLFISIIISVILRRQPKPL